MNNERMHIELPSKDLRYTDTSEYDRIAYPIRIGHGYVSDTPPIRIRGVSEF